MNGAVRRAIYVTRVSRVIAHRRVVVRQTLSGLSLHDTHGPPIDGTNPLSL
jgi:hypothetical protein